MMHGVQMVPMGEVRMVRGLFVMAGLVMFGRFLVMASGVPMVFGSLLMMFCGARRHWLPPSRTLLGDLSPRCVTPRLPAHEQFMKVGRSTSYISPAREFRRIGFRISHLFRVGALTPCGERALH
jgi:hypothetical protein